MKKAFGVDIGATGIKGGVVDLDTASLVHGRHRVLTPQPSLPLDVLNSVQALIDFYKWKGPLGLGFPATFINGICTTAVNIDASWKGMNVVDFFTKNLNRKVLLGNDADVAGLAEFYANDNLRQYDKVLFLTLGTGIGSAFIYKGVLIPNFEMGQLKWKKDIIEKYSSNKARTDNKLTWKQFGKRLQKTLKYYNLVLSPDIIVLGGGISKKMDQYESLLDLPIPIVPAQLKNNAGIIGAALLTN